jgi:hypothetical protein
MHGSVNDAALRLPVSNDIRVAHMEQSGLDSDLSSPILTQHLSLGANENHQNY